MQKKIKDESFITCLLVAAIFLAGSPFADAQTQQTQQTQKVQQVQIAKTITWEEAVKLTATQNPEYRSAIETMNAAVFSVSSAKGNYLPQVNGSLDYSQSSNANTNYSAQLKVSQNLFAGFQDDAKIRQLNARVQIAKFNLQAIKARLSADLKSAFMGYIYMSSSQKLLKAISLRREKTKKLVELRYQNGRENKGSVLLSMANLRQADYEVLIATHGIENSYQQLMQVIGSSDDAKWVLQEGSDVPKNEPLMDPQFSQLALVTPEVQLNLAQEVVADSNLTLAQAAFYPSLNLSAGIGREGVYFFPENERWSIGVNLTVPLFSGGKDYYLVKSAGANFVSARLLSENSKNLVTTKLKQAYNGFTESMEKLKVDQSFLDAAKVRAEIARNKYNNGLMTFDEWDLIESDLVLREKNFLQSQRDRVLAEANWEQNLGTGVLP